MLLKVHVVVVIVAFVVVVIVTVVVCVGLRPSFVVLENVVGSCCRCCNHSGK